MNNDKLLRPEDASKLLKVTVTTLNNWTRKGILECIRTKGGHRRFLLSSIIPLSKTEIKQTKRNICYCRVSTSSQKEDLDKQVIFFRSKYPEYEIIKDIGSGINFKRKGFNYQDRLCRFGFELIKRIIEQQSDGKIVVLNKTETSPEQELVNDLISIITVFSSRLYGLRSNKLKKQIKEEAFKKETKTV